MSGQWRGARFAYYQLPRVRRSRPGDQLTRFFSGLSNLSALSRCRSDHRETVPPVPGRGTPGKNEPHHVEVPTRLNAEQRQKLEEFAALCGEENTPMRKSFFERAKEFFQ